MNPSDFSRDCPGKLVPVEFVDYPDGPLGKPQQVKSAAFVPDKLPPKLDWDAIRLEQFDRYQQTISVLGKLNGLHRQVGNAAGLLRTLWMREAKLSSKIENIDTTAEDLVLAGAGRTLEVRDSGKESWNYVRALEHGVSSTLPWSTRVICEMHKLLLSDVRGEVARPGELRDRGVYLGDRSRGVKFARFVPMPSGDPLRDALSSLEKFVNATHPKIPPLFVIALTHYQFETIHPFSDGNGRIGRVLISRSLVKEGLLEQPVVYMSAYINEHRDEYVDLLLAISQRGGENWSRWIGFILEAIRTQALDAIWRSEQLISLRDEYHRRAKDSKLPTSLLIVIDRLFSMPAINVAEIGKHTGVTKPTASNYVTKLEEIGVLTEYTGRDRDRDWIAREIVNIIEQDAPID